MKNRTLVFNKKELAYTAGRSVAVAICIFTGACLLIHPEQAKQSLSDALFICSDTVIGSLFPFLFLSSFIIGTGLPGTELRAFRYISQKVFDLPPDGIAVFIMSAIGGFPVGAKMTAGLLESGKTGRDGAKRLLMSCVNPAPAFAVTAVGYNLFSSKKTGIIIYASVVISNFFILLFSRFFIENNDSYPIGQKKRTPISAAFVNAGNTAAEATVGVCCYVLLFSCFCGIMKSFIKSESVLGIFCGIFEVTNGCRKLSAIGSIPLIAGVIGWGGLSVHFQIMGCIEKAGLGIKHFFASRAVCACLSCVVCAVLLNIFPPATQTVAIRHDVIIRQTEKGLPVSVMLLLTCFVFLIGGTTFSSQELGVN